MIDRGIQGLLQGFFNSQMIGDPPNGYSKPGWVGQIRNSGDSLPEARAIPLDEEEAALIEPIMNGFRLSNPQEYTILELFYRFGWSDGKIARDSLMGCSGEEITTLRHGIEARLEISLTNAV